MTTGANPGEQDIGGGTSAGSLPESSPIPLRIRFPLSAADVRRLRVGDRVLCTGLMYGARDQAHRMIVEGLARSEDSPIPLDGQVIYYVGPAPTRPGRIIGPAGPTTAARMDTLTIPLIERGVRGFVGKGRRSLEVRDALRRHGAVYFVAVGGAAALLAERIKRQEVVAFPELATEAVLRLEIEDFPLMVANDIYGGDLFEAGMAGYRARSSTLRGDEL